MLGDGCIPKSKYNCCLQIAHKGANKEYIQFKYNILSNLNMVGKLQYNITINPRYKSPYDEYRFKSKASILFKKLRNKFYPLGKKQISFNLIKNIDNLGLSIWYMDDGNKTKYGYEFNTQCFSLEEKQMLQVILKAKWDINTTLVKSGVIYVLAESKNKLTNAIYPFITSDMKYKIHGSCINRVNCKNDKDNPTCSQACNALQEGSTTTGDVGSLNYQLERPTLDNLVMT